MAEEAGDIAIKIQNVVSTLSLGIRLDLVKITNTARNAEYNPARFQVYSDHPLPMEADVNWIQAVIMRIREPKSTSLMFASGNVLCFQYILLIILSVGKVIVTGCRSEGDCQVAAQKFLRILEKVGFPVNPQDLTKYQYKVQNMTATCDFGFPIGLEALIFSYSAFATYEPELFPGLVYRMPSPKVVLLVFVSGKVVLTGAKTQEDARSAYENIYPILLECRKKQLVQTSWYEMWIAVYDLQIVRIFRVINFDPKF